MQVTLSGMLSGSTQAECFCFFAARASLPAIRNYKSVPLNACDAGTNLGKASDANKNQGNAEDCTSLAMVLRLLVVDDHLNDNPLHSLFLSPGIKRL